MKKSILTLFVSMIMCSTAYADETIQLAAVMGGSDSSNIQANQRVYASENARSSGSSGSASRTPGFEFAVISGVVVAATIASLATDSTNSTSNH